MEVTGYSRWFERLLVELVMTNDSEEGAEHATKFTWDEAPTLLGTCPGLVLDTADTSVREIPQASRVRSASD